LNLRELGVTGVGSCAAVTQWRSAVGRGLGELGFLRIHREQPRCIRGHVG
jgi:hypothetical protein